jgi:eukaryotic-like serine/threonine-protein kinase
MQPFARFSEARAFCGECGSELPDGKLASRCPHCLLALALSAEDAADGNGAPHLPRGGADSEQPVAQSLGRVGDYELINEIAHGGMGAVYMARHLTLNRVVALKRIRLDHWNNPGSVLRFELETRAIARLNHPNIIPLYEAGESGGLHYFTMKLVTGGSLASMLPARSPAHRRRGIECLVKVARAVHYAHQHGIIHRDLKPANILLDEHGEPSVADFGLAKMLESNSEITQTQMILGSPSYMAPEAGHSSATTTSVDIYSLGAILYEIIVGEPPFRAATAFETMRKVMEEPPRRPRLLDSRVDGDLEMVCLKCLEKEPHNRYSSASELADDLQRWLNGVPLKVRPASQFELLWRWCKRKPALACALSAVLALLIIVAAGSTFAATQIRAAQIETERVLLRMQFEKADQFLEMNDSSKGLALLAHVVHRHPNNLDAASRLAFELSFRNYAIPLRDPLPHESKLIALTPSAKGDAIVTLTENGVVRLWDRDSGQPRWETNILGEKALSAAFSRAAGQLAVATAGGAIQVWQVEPEWTLITAFANEHTASAKPLFIEPAGHLVGTVTRFQQTARFWNLSTGAEEFHLEEDAPILAAAISPNGQWAAFGRNDGRVTIWDLARRQRLDWKMMHDRYVTAVEFSPDGRYLASGSNDQTARIWDLEDAAKLALTIQHKHEVTSVQFSEDSQLLATGGLDCAVQIWEIANSRLVVDPIAHSEGVTSVCFLPGGEYLASASYKSLGWLWKISPAMQQPLPFASDGRVTSVDVSPDGTRIAAGSAGGTARVWEVETGRQVGQTMPHSNTVSSVRFSPDGTQLLTASFEGAARVWDLESGQARTLLHQDWVRTAKFNQEGTHAVTASHDRTAKIWNLNTGTAIDLEHDNDIEDAVFNNSGQRVATASKDAWARIWDAETGALLSRLKHESWVSSVQFSENDQMVLTASFDKTSRLWHLSQDELGSELSPSAVLRHDGEVAHAAFSPDGQWVVTASYDTSARVWNVRTGAPKPYRLSHKQPVVFAMFSPDNRRVVTASRDGTARVWSVISGKPLTGSLRHNRSINQVAFGPGCDWIVTGSCDGTARVWQLSSASASESRWLSDLARYVSRMVLDSDNQFLPIHPADHDRIKAGLMSNLPMPELARRLID